MKKIALIIALVMCMVPLFSCGKDDNGGGEITNRTFESGAVIGGNYTNYYSNVKIAIPSNWNVLSDKEIKQQTMSGSSFSQFYSASNKYDLVASDDTTGECLAIMFLDLSTATAKPEKFTVNDYIDIIKSSFKLIDSQGTVSWEPVKTLTLGGSNYTSLCGNFNMPSYSVDLDFNYLIRKIDHYMLLMLYCPGASSNSIETYSDNFSKALNK